MRSAFFLKVQSKHNKNLIHLVVITAVFLSLFFPLNQNPYFLHLMVLFLLNVLIGQSWNILGGYAGQVSFGNAIFYGVGAYCAALLATKAGSPIWVCMIASMITAVLFSLPFGLLTFHLKGSYFVVGTTAAAEIFRLLALNLRKVTGGPSGILMKPIYTSRTPFYFMIVGFAALVTLTILLLERSKAGLYFQAIRESQDASEALGIDTTKYKLFALCLSAAFAGLAGGFYTYYMSYIDPNIVFGMSISSTMILVVTVGGYGTAFGPFAGALIITMISEIFRRYLRGAHLFAYGALLVLIPIFMPNGIAGIIREGIKLPSFRKKEAS